MTDSGRVVVCVALILLAGCGGVVGDVPWSNSEDVQTPPPTDTTPTATPTPTGDGVVGNGTNATFTGGNFSGARLREVHRAYFDSAESVTAVSWGQIHFPFMSDASSNSSHNVTVPTVVLTRRNASTGILREHTVPSEDARTLLRGTGTTASLEPNATVAYRNASAPGTYVNETGAVFLKERADGGVTHKSHPAGSSLANFSTEGNVTDMRFRALVNTAFDYQGTGNVSGFSGHVYTASNVSALDDAALSGVNRKNVSTFSMTVVVAPEGYVRYLNLTLAVETYGGSASLQVQKAIIAVNETVVSEPDWLPAARENPRRTRLDAFSGNETTNATGNQSGVPTENETADVSSRYANETATLEDGNVTMNLTLNRSRVYVWTDIEGTERFDNANLDEWRVGSVARYYFETAEAERVEITIHYDDAQVSRSEADLTVAVWDREQQFFHDLNSTVDAENNTVTTVLTGEQIERWQGNAFLALDYEQYYEFFESDDEEEEDS
jgi:hypothetical protein